MSKRMYNVVSLFSGGMGLDLGLERTKRFRVLACIEKEHTFCETIRRNREAGQLGPYTQVYEGDITNFDPLMVLDEIGLRPGEVDLLVGGPPCQSFSTTGRRRTVVDPRGTLLWQFLRFVEVMQPRFFLMENVRGLLSAALRHRPLAQRPNRGGPPLADDERPGSVVRLLSEDFRKLSDPPYHMDCFEVNAVNYGAPQLRERGIFIGNRYNLQVDFPDPMHGPPGNGKRPWATLRSAIADLDDKDPQVLDFSPRKKRYLSLIPEGANWRSLPEATQKESMGKAWHAKGGRSGWWRRLTYDLPCPTLVTMPNHASTSLCHPTETRALSIREYARVQEFPDDWQFAGTVAERYAQVGNAVPLRLGRVAGNVIAQALDDLDIEGFQVRLAPPDDYRIVYVQSHVRTRQWYKGGRTVVWGKSDARDQGKYPEPRTLRKTRAVG